MDLDVHLLVGHWALYSTTAGRVVEGHRALGLR